MLNRTQRVIVLSLAALALIAGFLLFFALQTEPSNSAQKDCVVEGFILDCATAFQHLSEHYEQLEKAQHETRADLRRCTSALVAKTAPADLPEDWPQHDAKCDKPGTLETFYQAEKEICYLTFGSEPKECEKLPTARHRACVCEPRWACWGIDDVR